METNRLFGPATTAQFAVALALLITFTSGHIVGRHVATETRARPGNTTVAILGPHFPYQLHQPVRKLALPGVLREASAISYVDGSRVGIVQDEQGTIFICSSIDGHIIQQISFAASGDFEGLAIVGDDAWILRSDGDLYRVNGLRQTRPQIRKVETFLRHKDNTEGLAYDAAGRQLLIGLKAPPKLDGHRRRDKRAVFAYQLQRRSLSAAPFLLLDMNELKRVYSSQVAGGKAEKFDPQRRKDFQPSDLAIHPITGHIYHIAAGGQLLVVSDRSGQIYFVRHLPKKLFRQPEGISFDPHGNMFIVNEGAGSHAMLLEFRYQPIPEKVATKRGAVPDLMLL